MHVIPCQEICNAVTWPDIWPDEVLAVQWPEIRQLIQIRLLQNEANKEEKTGFIISCIIVVEANDPPDLVEKEIISSLRKIEVDQPIDEVFTPSFEWVLEHPTCYEVAFIHCDREYGICLLIPKAGIDPELLAMCAEYAVPVPELVEA